MSLTRRHYLKFLGLLGLAAGSPMGALSASPGRVQYVAAFADLRGGYRVGLLNQLGELNALYELPGRGHAARVSADGRWLVMVARRPGRWLWILDLAANSGAFIVNAAQQRHFYGHGVFNHDQGLFFTSENDYDKRRAVIGVYDCRAGFRRIDELSAHGVGSHELAFMPDGKTLVVANGGIETHPDFGRHKLNLDDMKPSLTYLDIQSDRQIGRFAPPDQLLSLRHLAVCDAGTVTVAAQYQGAVGEDVPLLFWHRGEPELQTFSGQPLASRRRMNHYLASVAFTNDARWAISSAPRGDLVSVWDMVNRRWLRDLSAPDIGGVAACATDPAAVLLSSGNGQLYRLEATAGNLTNLADHIPFQWDNHLSLIDAG